jgi:ATP/maltotriose-dependent transcriptional regulator MalT
LRVAEAHLLMGMVALAQGRFDLAKGYLEAGLVGARQVHSAELTVAGLLFTASLARQTGSLPEAFTLAEDALQLSQGIDLVACEMWAHTETGLILLAQGQIDAAFTHTARALELVPRAHQGWFRADQVRQAHASILSHLKL